MRKKQRTTTKNRKSKTCPALLSLSVIVNHKHNAIYHPHTFRSWCPKTDLNRAVSLCILPLFCAFLQEKRGYPTPENAILHPILHPKSPVNTGILGYGCRKCRIFFQNIFRRERRGSGLGVAKHRTSLGKSTDVLHRKYGCLPQRSPMFLISEKEESVERIW